MSTDESDLDNGKEILVNHQLPWLSETVNNFKQILDQESLKGKSQQSLRQMKTKIETLPQLDSSQSHRNTLHVCLADTSRTELRRLYSFRARLFCD